MKEVDEAGEILARNPTNPAELRESTKALNIINNWRSSHAYPLNTFNVTLRYKAKQIHPKRLVAQRIKRLSSIYQKLRRFDWLKLSRMQDIGGCRAIVDSIQQVDDLVKLYRKSGLKHKLDDEDDYIRNPKRSGYRGIHLIYRYNSDKRDTYNGLKIEMQFRSLLQHVWATAVETVGTFKQQALKASQGEQAWLRFFALMGCAMAHLEGSASVPETPEAEQELELELRELAKQLDVETTLRAYRTALKLMGEKKVVRAHYFLVEVDAKARRVAVHRYLRDDIQVASKDYADAERRVNEGAIADAVLVSVDSVAALRRAYPNYFLDTHAFIEVVNRVLKT